MPFIYLQVRLACACDSISALDYCCTLTLSWTDHQEKQLKSPSVSISFCPLSLPAAWLYFAFESGFDHVGLSIRSYTGTNDSSHSSPGTAVRQLKKNPNFFVFYLHTSLNACGSKDGLRTEFHFLEHTVRVEAYSWCISTMLNNRQGEPPQILAALQWSNMVRGLATESVGFQTDCEECRFLMAVNSPFLSSLEQLSFMSLRNWLIK